MKKINDILNIPESWEDITIKQLKDMKNLKDSTSAEAQIELIKVFNPDIDIMNVDFASILQAITSIYDVLSETPKPVKSDGSFNVGEVVYKLKDIDNIDFSTFLDFQSLSGGDNEWEKIQNLGLILSLLTEDKPTDDVKEFAEVIEKNVDVITATSLLLFFSEKLITYLQDTPIYSQYMEQMTKNEKEKITE